MGAVLDERGQLDDAAKMFRAVLSVDPGNLSALNWLGSVLAKKGGASLYEALYCFWRCLKAYDRPAERKNRVGHALALVNRAMVMGELGHYEEAIPELRKAIQINPDDPAAHDNLGHALAELGEHQQAIRAFDRAIELRPGDGLLHHNKSVSLCKLGEQERALPIIRKALELDQTLIDARFNLGLTSLYLGDYETGFREYEGRWATKEYQVYNPLFPAEKWIGQEPIAGKSLLLVGDQGFGDMIMFSRYVPMAVAAGAKVYLRSPKGLFDLFRDTFTDVTVFKSGEELPETDWRTALGSLPRAFGTLVNTIPKPVAFFYSAEASKRWCISDKNLKVGICWSGSFEHKQDRHRSMPFRDFAGILGIPGVTYYSLQYDVRDEDKPDFDRFPGIVRLPIETFQDTAAVIHNLDMVITVDTSVAHIAGSMGVPTWVLISAIGSDWRWLKHRNDSPWYPSVSLHRQRSDQKWPDVIRQVAGSVLEVARGRADYETRQFA